MLIKPFSGKELFLEHESQMNRINMSLMIDEDKNELWELHTGKQKKQAWNNLAKLINLRMQFEVREAIDKAG